jgi:hypothetical protein
MPQPVVGSAVLPAALFANLADTEACKDAPAHKKKNKSVRRLQVGHFLKFEFTLCSQDFSRLDIYRNIEYLVQKFGSR